MNQRLTRLVVADSLILTFTGAGAGVAAQSRLAATQPAQAVTGVTGTVRAFLLNLRSSPGVQFVSRLGSNRIGLLRMGASLVVFGRDRTARWLKIKTGGGMIGWVSMRWVLLRGSTLMALPIVS